MTIDIYDAADRISAAEDLRAEVSDSEDEIRVYRFGRVSGVVTQMDLDSLGRTPTGWGKGLRNGKLAVWRAITGN